MAMRALDQVIDQLLKVVPMGEDLHRMLKSQYDTVMYSAPELMPMRWRQVADILVDEMGIPPFTELWKKQVVKIWLDK